MAKSDHSRLIPYKERFEYYNNGSPANPRNPAIEEILVGPGMERLLREYGVAAQSMYWRRVVCGKKYNKIKNYRSTRLKSHIGEVETSHSMKRQSPRWVVDMEAYAPHALAREFGRVRDNQADAPDRWRKERKDRNNDAFEPVNTRDKAERVLGGYRRKQRSIVETLEKLRL